MDNYKRHQTFANNNNVLSEDTIRLQMLGMRIRQSVSNGYQLPQSATDNNNNDMNNSFKAPMRVPLPNHMDAPPPLDYNGSTCSSLAGWENEIETNNLHRGLKRNFEENNNNINENDMKERQVSDFVQRYGPLVFDEEF